MTRRIRVWSLHLYKVTAEGKKGSLLEQPPRERAAPRAGARRPRRSPGQHIASHCITLHDSGAPPVHDASTATRARGHDAALRSPRRGGARPSAGDDADLGHLHERHSALLHARAAGAARDDDRQALRRRVLERAGQLLACRERRGRRGTSGERASAPLNKSRREIVSNACMRGWGGELRALRAAERAADKAEVVLAPHDADPRRERALVDADAAELLGLLDGLEGGR